MDTRDDLELWPGASTPGWDSVDEAGWESFPASDPPAIDSVFELEPGAFIGAGAGQQETDTPTLDDAEQRAPRDALDDE